MSALTGGVAIRHLRCEHREEADPDAKDVSLSRLEWRGPGLQRPMHLRSRDVDGGT